MSRRQIQSDSRLRNLHKVMSGLLSYVTLGVALIIQMYVEYSTCVGFVLLYFVVRLFALTSLANLQLLLNLRCLIFGPVAFCWQRSFTLIPFL